MSPWFRVSLLLLAWLVHAAAASSTELAVNLSWQGPSECQDDGSVGQEIRRIVGDSLPVPDDELFVNAVVTKTADGSWAVSLRTRVADRTGERTLIGATCAEVRRATALIVALMINPNVRVDSGPPAPEPPVERPTPRPAPVAQPEQPTRTEQPRPESKAPGPQVELGLGALAGLGVLPEPSGGFEASAGVAFSAVALELSGSAWLPRSRVSDSKLRAGGEFTLLGAELLVCSRPLTPARLGGCAGPAIRHMRGEGFGVSAPGHASATWAAATVEAFALLELSASFWLRATLGAEVPFRPPSFSLAGLGVVHSPSAVAGHAGLGALLRF